MQNGRSASCSCSASRPCGCRESSCSAPRSSASPSVRGDRTIRRRSSSSATDVGDRSRMSSRVSRADCAALAVAPPRPRTSLTPSRKPSACFPPPGVGRARTQQPLARGRRHRAGRGASARLRGEPVSAAYRARRGRGSARPRSHGRALAPRRWGRRALLAGSVRALRAASASTLRIASSSARRSLVISDSESAGSTPRNCVTKRGARPFIECPAGFPGALVKPFDGAGDERMIVGHYLSLRSPP